MSDNTRFKSFRDLPVWKESLEISSEIFNLTEKLPQVEDFGLTSQMRRSENSISANIAEAFGREHLKEKQNFYRYSRGSAFELQSHLLYGNKVRYFPKEIIEYFDNEIENIIISLNKIIKTLKDMNKK